MGGENNLDQLAPPTNNEPMSAMATSQRKAYAKQELGWNPNDLADFEEHLCEIAYRATEIADGCRGPDVTCAEMTELARELRLMAIAFAPPIPHEYDAADPQPA